ncbi:acetyltransferase [Xylariales sp. PMI_506]|nr:acetyltransferase [Xylariales sp. PMI_506]
MANYTIAQCTVADGAAVTRNNMSAFWQDPHFVLSWPHRTLEYHISQATLQAPSNLLDMRLTKRHQKAVDAETGHVLGYARWFIPPSHATSVDGTPAWAEAVIPAVSAEEEAEIRRVAETAVWDPNTAPDVLLEPIKEAKKKIFAKKQYMRLDYLAVHPDYQGRGIGTALCQSGMKEAEKLGLDIFIHAMKAGMGVYTRLGFHVMKEIIQDDSEFGGQGEYCVYLMTNEQVLSSVE